MCTNLFRLPQAGLLLVLASSMCMTAQVSLIITVAPPPIPVYEQPLCPEDGYAWMPGYWAWGDDGYFWVPGTWTSVPGTGLLWTPGYWGWAGGAFVFHSGYWASQVGFYGGINYGYGYAGSGFEGGRWQGRHYYYNRAVSNVDSTRSANVYSKPMKAHGRPPISYLGGKGGVRAAPTPLERRVGRLHRVPPTREQAHHQQAAGTNRELLASANRGKPPVAATVKPADFSPRSAMPAKAPGGQVDESTLKANKRTLQHPSAAPVPGGVRPDRPVQQRIQPDAGPARPEKRMPREPIPRRAPPAGELPLRRPAPQHEPVPVPRPAPERPRGPLPPHREPPHPTPSPEPRPGRESRPRPVPQEGHKPEPNRPEAREKAEHAKP